MSNETIVIAVATILGPIASVGIALWIQSRMQRQQNKWQKDIFGALEKERRDWEFKREESRGKYVDAWNVATRDRADKLINALERIAEAMQKKS